MEATIRYDPELLEEAVFLAVRGEPAARNFHRERSRIYEISDPEERERAFQELYRAWFSRLGLDRLIEKAVEEQPLVAGVDQLIAGRATTKLDEGAELFVGPQTRTVRLLLRPESFLDPSALLALLRHELMHIADMLDPRFDYEPTAPPAEGGAPHGRLLRERYRVVWDATIDGRMVRRGWAPESLRAERLAEFCQTFPLTGEGAEKAFGRFFDREPHTHAELMAFAANPGPRPLERAGQPGSPCPLCRFPTYAFEPEPELLPADLVERITREFPRWRPAHGLCVQCAQLYRARAISEAAARELPGGR